MKDRLEEFVRNNSMEFDINEPNPELWNKIEKSIQPKKVIRWSYYLSRAAVVVFIIGASLAGQQLWMKKGSASRDHVSKAEINIPEIQEAEMYYSGMINAKLEEVKPYFSEYPSLEDELNSDLFELDSIYISLKNDLQDNIANHEVIEAMIQNYRMRISILEDMMEFLEANNEEETTNNTELI